MGLYEADAYSFRSFTSVNHHRVTDQPFYQELTCVKSEDHSFDEIIHHEVFYLPSMKSYLCTSFQDS